MVIERNTGFVGIGTSAPDSVLHISSGTDGDCVLTIEADSDNSNESDNPRIDMSQDGGAISCEIGIEGNAGTRFTGSLLNATYIISKESNAALQFGTNSTTRMSIMPNTGNVGIKVAIPTHALDVAGTAGLSTGTLWTNTSDISVKKNIKIVDTDNCLKSINSLIIKSFKYKKAYADENQIKYNDISRLGLIAQDVITTHKNPNIVTGIKNSESSIKGGTLKKRNSVNPFVDDYDLLQLNCSELLFDAFGAIQALSRQVADLQRQLFDLQNQTS